MGLMDGVKPKTAGPIATKPIETTAKVASPSAPTPAAPSKPEAQGEGFDVLRKKLMSVSGRYVAHKPNLPVREDLQEMVSGRRLAESGSTIASMMKTPVMQADAGKKPAAKESVYGVNETGLTGSMNTGSGPITAEQWQKPELLVGNLRQDTGIAGDKSSSDRCGPTNLIAGALLQGSEKAAQLIEKQARAPLSQTEQTELRKIAKDVREKTATFEQLSSAGDLMYKLTDTRMRLGAVMTEKFSRKFSDPDDRAEFNRLRVKDFAKMGPSDKTSLQGLLAKLGASFVEIPDPRDPSKTTPVMKVTQGSHSGLDDGEMLDAATGSGIKAESLKYEADADRPATEVLRTLKNGESAVLRLGQQDDLKNNHFVTVGRMPDGRPYVYNPSPSPGDATLVISKDKNFGPELKKALAIYDKRSAYDTDSVAPRYTKIKY